MSSDSIVTNVDAESMHLPADIGEVAALARDTDGACTVECHRTHWTFEVKQEHLPVVKQEPDDVSLTGLMK